MSNFLAHLIARASQQAPVLARRQPALFEPATAWAPPQSVTWPEPSATQASPAIPPIAGQTRHEPRPRQDRQATQDAVVRRGAPEEAVQRSAAAMPMSEGEAPRNVVRMAPATAPIADVRAVVTHQVRHAPPPAEPQSAHTATAIDATVVPRLRPAPFADGAPRPRETTAPRRDLLPRPATEAAEAVRQHQDPPTGVLLPARPQNTQAVQLAKAAPARAAPTGATAVHGTNESVQITIGRVEVRAVTATERPAVRVTKPAAPRLTLDDYLRQRSGGGR